MTENIGRFTTDKEGFCIIDFVGNKVWGGKYSDETKSLCNQLNNLCNENRELKAENKQLKQFPVKLDNRIQKLEESLKALREMEDDNLNPQAVEDVATVIAMSLNALMEFRKELKGDVE